MIFRTGDRVRCVRGPFCSQSKGNLGTVLETHPNLVCEAPYWWTRVRWDYGYEDGYPAADLDLVEAAPALLDDAVDEYYEILAVQEIGT